MRNFAWCVWLGLSIGIAAQTSDPPARKTGSGRPVVIATATLAGFDALPADRRKLIEVALRVARDFSWLPYTPSGSEPSHGGFDCSGAMYYVMHKAGLVPPRTAADQFQWLKTNGRLHEVPAEALGLTDPSLKNLHPGDLLFWGTHASTDPAAMITITHVAMYLGTEKIDGRPVMINSSAGRSYRTNKADGYGVYDFHLQQAGAIVALRGYGTPPGVAKMPDD